MKQDTCNPNCAAATASRPFPRWPLLLALCAVWLSACSDGLTDAEDAGAVEGETEEVTPEGALTPDSTSFSAEAAAQIGLSLAACGNGTQSDGELCFTKPTLASSLTGDLGGIAVGRINANNPLDFVVAGVTLDKIRTKFGSGNGTFPGTHTWTMGDGPTDVALADFNGDGQTDIIATNVHTQRVRIRWGHTNWSSWSQWTTGSGPWRVATGDVNGDGLDDFVTTNIYADNLTVRKRKAAGGFTSQTYAAGDSANDVELADCDNDGDLDLLYPSGLHNATVKVRKNDGSGVFAAPQTVNMASGYNDNFHAITLADFNNDGKLDLIAARNSHALVRVLGNGNCTFQAPVASAVPNNPYQLYASDFDKDGNQDLVVAHLLAGRITIYLGQGNGNMTGPYVYDAAFGVNGHTSDVGVGDFNADGSPDLVYNGNGGPYVMLSNP